MHSNKLLVVAYTGKKSINWADQFLLSWAKEVGGMNFKDFELMNEAFLVNQVWRTLESPNSLISRWLKVRYFHNTRFLILNFDRIHHRFGKVSGMRDGRKETCLLLTRTTRYHGKEIKRVFSLWSSGFEAEGLALFSAMQWARILAGNPIFSKLILLRFSD